MELESLTNDLVNNEEKLISVNKELQEFKDKNRVQMFAVFKMIKVKDLLMHKETKILLYLILSF